MDCRINRANANNKVPFGFVVFDSEEPVKELLMLKVCIIIQLSDVERELSLRIETF